MSKLGNIANWVQGEHYKNAGYFFAFYVDGKYSWCCDGPESPIYSDSGFDNCLTKIVEAWELGELDSTSYRVEYCRRERYGNLVTTLHTWDSLYLKGLIADEVGKPKPMPSDWVEADRLISYPYFLRLQRGGTTYCRGLHRPTEADFKEYLIWFRDNVGFTGIVEVECCTIDGGGMLNVCDKWYIESLLALEEVEVSKEPKLFSFSAAQAKDIATTALTHSLESVEASIKKAAGAGLFHLELEPTDLHFTKKALEEAGYEVTTVCGGLLLINWS